MELTIAVIILFILLLVESGFLLFMFFRFRNLTMDVKKGNLISVLDDVLSKEKKNSGKIKDLVSEIQRLDKESVLNIKNIGVVRFNPFEELGGDHSFSVAMLDGSNSGFILTGLHTRERTRVYVKEVIKGKTKLDLSEEEKRALGRAFSAK